MLVSAAGCVWYARRHPGRRPKALERALALAILAGWAGEYVADIVLGLYSARYTLPLQLTDVISVTAALALWTRRQSLVELTYFWAFTATLQAVVTPDLAYAFPSVFYFTYFVYHVGAIVAASLLVFGCRQFPRPGAVWRVYAATLGWAVLAGAGDLITGGNYMYLRSKPEHGSLLSVLGPWPRYIAGAAVVGLAMLLIVAGLTRAGQSLGARWAVGRGRIPAKAKPEAVR